MSPVTHQTVKLSKGKHITPEDGACVMELASMLAGEPFSDHPACACPVIASFLRAYNDSIGDTRRQDLFGHASKIVGSRTTGAVQRRRAARLTAWEIEMRRSRLARRLIPPPLRDVGLPRSRSLETAGTHAVHAIRRHTDTTHARVLALLDELLSMGHAAEAPPIAFGAVPPARKRSFL